MAKYLDVNNDGTLSAEEMIQGLQDADLIKVHSEVEGDCVKHLVLPRLSSDAPLGTTNESDDWYMRTLEV